MLKPTITTLTIAVVLGACSDSTSGNQADIADADVVDDVSDTAAPDADPTDTVVPGQPSWWVNQQDLSSAVLAVWGKSPTDIWVVGADKDDGQGPLIAHGTSTGWERIDLRAQDPAGGHVWWAAGPGDQFVYFVGENGRAFRYDRSSGTAETIDTGTDATLYGVWGASDSELWAVGGYVFPDTGPPTVVRITPEGASTVTLPASVADDVTLFKAWGSAADNVYVVGEKGTVLHWDGSDWSHTVLDGEPRLVTLHGAASDDMVVVGGTSQALILERGASDDWSDASPGPYSLLNGTYVSSDGTAYAAGLIGTVFQREDGEWATLPLPPVIKDWHAVWVDPRGDAWVAGGRLLSAAQFDQGALLHYGPPRDDLPPGPIPSLPTMSNPDPDPDADVIDSEVDEPEVVDMDADVNEADEVSGDVDTMDDVDTGPEPDTDTSDDNDVPDTVEDDTFEPVDTSLPPVDMVVGQFDAAGVVFTEFVSGQEIEIIQGPQGGVHIEIALDYGFPGGATSLPTEVNLFTEIDGQAVGDFVSLAYPTPMVGVERYRTFPIPLIFYTDLADPYVGANAVLNLSMTLPDNTTRAVMIDVVLVDNVNEQE